VPAWACACVNRKPWQRHLEPWQCLPDAAVKSYQRAQEIPRENVARMLLWLESEFRCR
jgi:hypothetical protein